MKSRNFIFCAVALVGALIYGAVWAIDPAAAHQMLAHPEAFGAMAGLAMVGDTGDNEKPSLYFEIRENGKAVDPLSYFSPESLAKWQ